MSTIMFEVTVDARVYLTFHLAVEAGDAEEAQGLVEAALQEQGGEVLTLIYGLSSDPDRPAWLNRHESWSNDNTWEQVTYLTADDCEIADVAPLEQGAPWGRV